MARVDFQQYPEVHSVHRDTRVELVTVPHIFPKQDADAAARVAHGDAETDYEKSHKLENKIIPITHSCFILLLGYGRM